MAKDEPYDMMPHREIVELKKQLQKLKTEKFSSQELTSSVHTLTKTMDSMLKLFKEAAEELKFDEKEIAMNKKLDAIVEQNKIIADGMLTVTDLVKNFAVKPKGPEPAPVPKPNFQNQNPEPAFQDPISEPSFQQSSSEPSLNDPGLPPELPPQPQGPVAMPSIPFSSLDEPPKPKKKGLFGRLMK